MKRALLTAALLAIITVGVALWIVTGALKAPMPFAEPRRVTIHKGERFAQVARKLTAAGVTRNTLVTILYGEWTGQGSRVKPGEYAFGGGESLDQVLRHLVNGDFLTITVIIPEGMTMHQIGQRLAASGLVCASNFDSAATNGQLVQALGLGTIGAEGFLFPATYRFPPSAGTDQLLGAMLERFYAILTPSVEQRMFELGLDARQLVTFASIVEKEAKVPGERPVIASVFYNRLASGMPLQSDPTAQYNFAGEKERAFEGVHKSSAYNTYFNSGLPPGPIANPGLSSIQAVLYPATTDYLYFVARSDGTHVFSRSLIEHQRAIRELRRKGGSSRLTGNSRSD
jgi:UPF0755 protein